MSAFWIGAVAAVVGVFGLGFLLPTPNCPQCNEPLPKFRKARNGRQIMWGGWTCAKCGCEVTRGGKKVV